MKNTDLEPGRKYLHRRRTVIAGIPRQAERWMKCEQISDTGAVFSRILEPDITLTNEQIKKELAETWER